MTGKKEQWKRRGGSSSQIVSFYDDGSERGVVAQVCTDGGTFTKEEAIAHQNLVAAAPDLLSAAKEAVLILASFDASAPNMLRAAIAKAEAAK